MGRLLKKTKKFVRKHLPTAIKNRRKFKSIRDSMKRRYGGKNRVGNEESDDQRAGLVENQPTEAERSINDKTLDGVVGNIFLDNLVGEDEENTLQEDSSSESYLSEGSDCPYISGSENEDDFKDNIDNGTLLGGKSDLDLEILKQKKKLNKLKKKDPSFSAYLERHRHVIEGLRDEEQYSDEELVRDAEHQVTDEEHLYANGKLITAYTLDVWFWLVLEVEQPNKAALAGLLNGYQTACHYCLDDSGDVKWQSIPNKDVYAKILMFMLSEADGIFRRVLGVSDSCDMEAITRLKNVSQWKTMSPSIKSYLRSTLFLLNQLTDNSLLAFVVSRLRASVTFFAAFPSLLRRAIKIIVHLWATGEDSLFTSSFLILKDMALKLSPGLSEICLTRAYRAFIGSCKFVELETLKHMENLGDSIVELYSLDVHKSYHIVLTSLQQLTVVLRHAIKTKKKEEHKKIYNWQFMKCIDIWVKFISMNLKDYDLQPLLNLAIQIIKGVAHLFQSPRYLPLRLRCVQMLNQLSSSSGVFIPVAYLVLDFLDLCEKGGNNSEQQKAVSIYSVLKAPKPWLKSRDFQEKCILSSIELLSAHFYQWSYHISFPDLATIPLILLKRFYQKVTIESLRRPLKRLIDQVEQNSEFVQRKRDDASFSVNDQSSIETFLQMEKSCGNAPFTTYYNNIKQKALTEVV